MRIHGLPVSANKWKKYGGGVRRRRMRRTSERGQEERSRKEEVESNVSLSYWNGSRTASTSSGPSALNAIPVRFLRGTSGFRLVRQSETVHLAFHSSYSTSFFRFSYLYPFFPSFFFQLNTVSTILTLRQIIYCRFYSALFPRTNSVFSVAE